MLRSVTIDFRSQRPPWVVDWSSTGRRRLHNPVEISTIPHPERGDEGGLREVDLAELAQSLFAFFAFSE
jgi:hypothetical protein